MTNAHADILLFGLCCAISAGHLFTGVLGFALGRQRMELNALFAALTTAAAWTVFWLGAGQVFPTELMGGFRFASQLMSTFIGPVLLLFCWGLVHPERPLPRASALLLLLGLPGVAMSTYGLLHPTEVVELITTLEAGERARHPVFTPLFVTHSAVALITASAAIGVLLHAVARSPLAQVRSQAAWMLLAALTALAGFVSSNVLFAVLRYDMPFAAPLASIPALGLAYRALLSSRHLVEQLKTQHANLSRFVPSVVARSSTRARLGGSEAQVAVLFTDLRGFTALAEDLEPAQVIEILNAYLGRMTEVVQAHEGIVDKYIGDAVLAVFGLEDSGRHPCQDAWDAGLSMQRALEELNHAGRTPNLKMGVGIHFGTVVHGNVGSEERMDYTVLGDTVNLASRIEAMCKELQQAVVVTEAVASHLEEDLVDLGEQVVRGRRQPVRVFGRPS